MSTTPVAEQPPAPRSPHGWGLVINVSLVILAFALLGWVLWDNSAKIEEVFARPLDLRLLGLGILIFQISLLLTYVRWFWLIRVIEPRFRLGATLLLGSIGYVFNLVIPGAVGGDLIKAAYLVRMRVRKTQAIASMVIDRIVGLLGLFVLASGAGILAWGVAGADVRRLIAAVWLATVGGGVLLGLVFAQAFTRLFPSLLRTRHGRISLMLSELRTMSMTYRGRLGVVAAALGLSIVGHALNVVAFYLVGWMLFANQMSTTLAQHFLMVPLTLFTTAVPLPFGALGLSEGVGDQLFKLVGHPSGALAMMGFRVLMYACGLVGAMIYLFHLQEVRALTASAHELEQELIEGELHEATADAALASETAETAAARPESRDFEEVGPT